MLSEFLATQTLEAEAGGEGSAALMKKSIMSIRDGDRAKGIMVKVERGARRRGGGERWNTASNTHLLYLLLPLACLPCLSSAKGARTSDGS